MKAKSLGVMSVLAIAALLAGCSAAEAESPDPQVVVADQAAPAPDPNFTPEVEIIQPVNNSDEVISTCNREPGSGVIMTFDDYGTPEEVNELLSLLDELNWRAAFFPTGEWSLDNWGLIQRIQQEGHIVGNHTMTHPDLVELLASDEAEFYSEIYPLQDFATTDPMLIRPPFGSGLFDPTVAEIMTNNDAQLCGWTADTNDWRDDSTAENMLSWVMNGYEFSPAPLAPDGVVLAHIHGEHTLEFVSLLAAELDTRGWPRDLLEE